MAAEDMAGGRRCQAEAAGETEAPSRSGHRSPGTVRRRSSLARGRRGQASAQPMTSRSDEGGMLQTTPTTSGNRTMGRMNTAKCTTRIGAGMPREHRRRCRKWLRGRARLLTQAETADHCWLMGRAASGTKTPPGHNTLWGRGGPARKAAPPRAGIDGRGTLPDNGWACQSEPSRRAARDIPWAQVAPLRRPQFIA